VVLPWLGEFLCSRSAGQNPVNGRARNEDLELRRAAGRKFQVHIVKCRLVYRVEVGSRRLRRNEVLNFVLFYPNLAARQARSWAARLSSSRRGFHENTVYEGFQVNIRHCPLGCSISPATGDDGRRRRTSEPDNMLAPVNLLCHGVDDELRDHDVEEAVRAVFKGRAGDLDLLTTELEPVHDDKHWAGPVNETE
jgi:hypothetical protein